MDQKDFLERFLILFLILFGLCFAITYMRLNLLELKIEKSNEMKIKVWELEEKIKKLEEKIDKLEEKNDRNIKILEDNIMMKFDLKIIDHLMKSMYNKNV